MEDWRKAANKTQGEMAVLLGMKTQQNYGDIASGRKKVITLEVAIKFFEISGINLIDTTFSREKSDQPTLQSVKEMLADAMTAIDKIGLAQRVRPVVNSGTSGQASQSSEQTGTELQGPISIGLGKKEKGSVKSSGQQKGSVKS